MINIAGLTPVEDPSYRYKMPRLIPKVEGRGNGIKTVIVNVADIATSLNRDASEITKFFGCELGAQTTMLAEDDRYIVNGAHSPQDLQNLMHKYIELFVLCKNCHLPETHYKVKGDTISQKCVACGSKDLCDMTHKLATFILKQHKKSKSDKDTKDKKDKKKDKKDKTRDDEPEAKESTPEEEKSSKTKKEKKPKKKKSDDEELVDETLEADTEREALDSAMDQFRSWLAHNPDSIDVVNSTSASTSVTLKQQRFSQLYEELRSIQNLSSLRPADRLIIFIGVVFPLDCIADTSVVKYKEILNHFIPKKDAIQQRQLISAIEWLIGVRNQSPSATSTGGTSPTPIRFFPVLLKQLYDEDLLEEEVLFEWFHDSLRNEYTVDESIISESTLQLLKESSGLFIKWLQEAEEEDDEDQGDEDDDEEEK